MIVTGEAVYYLLQAESYLLQAKHARDVQGDMFAVNRTAAFTAQCAEYVLKTYLYAKGEKPSNTHSHKKLVFECKESGVKLPKDLVGVAGILYSYESSLRYDYMDNVDEKELNAILQVVEDAFEQLKRFYTPLVVSELKDMLPPALTSEVDDEYLIQLYWNHIDHKVDSKV